MKALIGGREMSWTDTGGDGLSLDHPKVGQAFVGPAIVGGVTIGSRAPFDRGAGCSWTHGQTSTSRHSFHSAKPKFCSPGSRAPHS